MTAPVNFVGVRAKSTAWIGDGLSSTASLQQGLEETVYRC
jgi:hypothetical protein